MSTMGCIPEFLKCQWVGERTWPGGKEAEGSWTGRWVREKVQIPLLDEQMGTSSNSCPTQDSEPRKRCEEKNPEQELEGTLKLQTFCLADGGRGSSWSGSRFPAWWCRFQKCFTKASNFSRDRGLAMATSTCTPGMGESHPAQACFNVNGILVNV